MSIQEQLKGQEVALLFICNHVTYRLPLTNRGGMPVRCYRGISEVQQMLSGFEALLERMQQNASAANP